MEVAALGALVVGPDAQAPGHAAVAAVVVGDDPRGRLEGLLHHPQEGIFLDVWKLGFRFKLL